MIQLKLIKRCTAWAKNTQRTFESFWVLVPKQNVMFHKIKILSVKVLSHFYTVLGKWASVNIVTSTDLTYLWNWHPVLPIDMQAWKLKVLKQGLLVCVWGILLWGSRFFRCVMQLLFFIGNSQLNCRIIESIFDMSLVIYTPLYGNVIHCGSCHKNLLLRISLSQILIWLPRKFATSDFTIWNFRERLWFFSLRTPRNIFRKFDEQGTNFICITLPVCCLQRSFLFIKPRQWMQGR